MKPYNGLANRRFQPLSHLSRCCGAFGCIGLGLSKAGAPAQACQQYATSVGILIDKFRLESGEVTSRDEHHNVTESQLDTEIAGLLADLAPAGKASAGAPASGNGNGRKPVGTAHTHGETEGLS